MNTSSLTMERIRRGFRLANRNWQLVVIQILSGLAVLAAAMLFIALPLGALLVAMGISAGSSSMGIVDFILGKSADPVGLATKSVAAILLLIVSFGLFVVFALGLSAFVGGGVAGTFWRSVSTAERFRFEYFLIDARRLFWGMLMFTLTILFIALGLLIVFGVTAGIGAAAYGAAGLSGTRMGVFVSTAGWLTLGACAAFFFFYLYMLILQGTVIIAHENPGSTAALKKAYSFVEDNPGGRKLLIALAGGYLGVEFVLGIIGALIEHIPGLGLFVSTPFQIGANLLGVYLGIAVLGGLVAYYYDAVVRPEEDELFRELEDVAPEDISSNQAADAESYLTSLSMPQEHHPDEQPPVGTDESTSSEKASGQDRTPPDSGNQGQSQPQGPA